jgi:hypothetical protein
MIDNKKERPFVITRELSLDGKECNLKIKKQGDNRAY